MSQLADTEEIFDGGMNQNAPEVQTPQMFVNPRLSNGAFQLTNHSASEVLLTRATTYWNRDAVKLEAVRFMPMKNLETTLAQYRAGEIDVISNAPFEPLTIKLLAPHEDFRRTTFGALNYYVFNRSIAPFDDRRVREAFALAVDRGRLARDVLGGASEAAQEFLPIETIVEGNEGKGKDASVALRTNQQQARRLLAEAGYEQGAGFPVVRLLINRSATHRSVAQAVAAMWRDTLGVKTELIIKDWSDYETALSSGDYTIARRSIVMQTPDEKRNLEAMFDNTLHELIPQQIESPQSPVTSSMPTPTASPLLDENTVANSPSAAATPAPSPSSTTAAQPVRMRSVPYIVSHEQAMRDLPGIPLYFASSFALVKPYVFNFEQNLLDAPALKSVSINQDWTPTSKSRQVTVETP
jgi:ABC-type oligopeptide transport system substrate-binding subunit